jgi:hypothetical protein
MQLGSRNESGDSMSLQLRLSAIYLGSPKKTPDKPAQQQPEANDEEPQL